MPARPPRGSTSRRSTRARCSSISARSASCTCCSCSPAGGPTRSCCPRPGCSAGSGCCSCSGCRRASSRSRSSARSCMLAQVQLVWLVIALTIVTVLALAIRSDAWLRTYKYTWAAVGIALLLATFVLGSDVNGARLTLSIGPLSGQPSELLKVILVVFLAGLPVREPVAARRREHADRAVQAAADPVPRADGGDGRDRAVDRRRPARPRRRPAVLRRVPRAAVRRDGPGVLRPRRAGAVPRRLGRPVQPVRARPAAGRQLARSVRGPAGHRVPDGPGAVRVRARRAARRGARQRPADDRRSPPDPGRPHGLSARGAGRGAGPHRPARDPRPVPRRHPARAADRGRRARRLPGAARRRARARRRCPGVHHRGRQPQAHPAHRDHAPVHLVRRVVAARQRGRRRDCCSRCPTAARSRRPCRTRAGVASPGSGDGDA